MRKVEERLERSNAMILLYGYIMHLSALVPWSFPSVLSCATTKKLARVYVILWDAGS